ncbi:MAG: lyase family protein, partial [Lentisphaeria bacterium]
MTRLSYENPLTKRYASAEMSRNWSPQNKFSNWRRLWIALARAEQELGMDISDAQIAEMEQHVDDINFETADKRERETKHDVMSHVYALGQQCPNAKPIIHLGATSCFVTDNSELVMLRDAMAIVRDKLVFLIEALRECADKYKDMPTLGFTHFQPAQLTTVGKRATLWLYDMLRDIKNLQRQIDELPFRGVKGTTGTQASFLSLFGGDHEKVKQLDQRVCELMGVKSCVPVSGQTYTRKIDFEIVSALSGIAQ